MANHLLNALAIPADMLWTDEFNWSPVKRTFEHSITGALLVDVGTCLSGRPITLEGDIESGWVSRSTLQALYAMASNPALPVVLTHADGRVFDVTWAEDSPIEASPVVSYSDPTGDTWYIVTLRLIEV
jgi:hypothetical protein